MQTNDMNLLQEGVSYRIRLFLGLLFQFEASRIKPDLVIYLAWIFHKEGL